MEQQSRILLKNGTVLIHDDQDNITPTKADLLITDNVISQIEAEIPPTAGMQVIDCTDSVISPGFISTHHHVWQTSLKGVHANETLFEYLLTGNFPSGFFTPQEMHWGQLSGALESMDAGTTTIVDHAHLNLSPEHSSEAIRATIASGIRSVFCYTPTPAVAQWKPSFELKADMLTPWVMQHFSYLAQLQPFGKNGRVKLGFAFDGTFLPTGVLQNLFSLVRAQNSALITVHVVQGNMFGSKYVGSVIPKLLEAQALGPDTILSHCTNTSDADLETIRQSGAHISSTPLTELQMGHGDPVCLDANAYHFSSLGVDCHSICTSSMPAQMNHALQFQRARRSSKLEARGKWSESLITTVNQVFNLGTIHGARAMGMGDEIGSLRVGKKADIVIFDSTTPSMLGVAVRDPVAAIVQHSSIRDVRTVIIDGIIRKENGKLREVLVPSTIEKEDQDGQVVDWDTIVAEVEKSRIRIDAVMKKEVDLDVAKAGLMHAWHLNKKDLCVDVE